MSIVIPTGWLIGIGIGLFLILACGAVLFFIKASKVTQKAQLEKIEQERGRILGSLAGEWQRIHEVMGKCKSLTQAETIFSTYINRERRRRKLAQMSLEALQFFCEEMAPDDEVRRDMLFDRYSSLVRIT